MKNAAASLRSGRSFNYTKIANSYTVNVGFPTAMGLPFYFSLQTPNLMYMGGQAQAKSHPDLASGNNNEIQPPQTVNASVDLQFVWVPIIPFAVSVFYGVHFKFGIVKNFYLSSQGSRNKQHCAVIQLLGGMVLDDRGDDILCSQLS